MLNAILRRNRAASGVLLVALLLLAWGWLLSGAGMGMTPSASLWPLSGRPDGMHGMSMPPTEGLWSLERFLKTLAMWWIMMMAMMLPSAAATILLFARVAQSRTSSACRGASEAFLAGYLIAWGAFSLTATLLHWWLEHVDLLAPMHMASISRDLAAAVLLLAGVYQLTPLKDACLRQCRSPARFLSRHYRTGAGGAFRMGMHHGAYCVGCCWMLMALLFVGGVMNLLWIALLTLLVAMEKLLPRGRLLATVNGALLISGGAILLI